MKSVKLTLCFLAIAALLGFALSCQSPLQSSESQGLAGDESILAISPLPTVINDIGQVKYINLEGGFWGIVGSKGNYEPLNLPKDFAVDGLWVIFQAENANVFSIHMWGLPIRILKIEKLGGKIITDMGVVKQVGIQGRPFIIEGVKGTYQPINLDPKYQVPGLKVKFTARLRPDIVIIPPLWPIIEILTISVVSEPISFKLGEEFKLPVTQIAVEPNAKITFTFESVISDSRCPSDVICVWAGEAIVSVGINIAGVNYGSYKLSTQRGANVVVVGRYSFTLDDLYPLPMSASPVSPLGYIGYFTVNYAITPTI